MNWWRRDGFSMIFSFLRLGSGFCNLLQIISILTSLYRKKENMQKNSLACAVRACLKIHSHNLRPPLCAIFAPNLVNVARYTS